MSDTMITQQVHKFEEPLKIDLEELLGRFQRMDSVRYEDFSSVWRELNFDEIFFGIKTMAEQNEFSRMALNISTAYFLPPYSFQIRVGGLYMLYALYHTQRSYPTQRIRLALKDWGDVQVFTQDALSSQHYDVLYILHQLLSAKAFLFTAMPIPLTYSRDQKVVNTNTEVPTEQSARPQELVTTEMCEEISNIHQHYKQLKTFVLAKHPDADLNLVPNLVPKLLNAVEDFSTWQNDQRAAAAGDEQSDSCKDEPSTSSTINQQMESSKRADLLASIKARSYGQVAEVSKARRHRQGELCTDTRAGEYEDQGPQRDRTHVNFLRRKRRQLNSLKSRTLRRLQHTGGVPGDSLSTTKLWKLSQSEQEAAAPPRNARRFRY
ncbi:snRNA-activating protein complex subunit 1b [Engraulis encrasicolus]|uniref:snRNA-activating protein complex subunit 1b n=1 Tax=Engraulis encrasicolus TaxID=184585 RepID=UPI002FD021A4